MNKKDKFRAVILGLGKIASRYQEDPRRRGIVTHAAAYRAHPRCELVAGFDRNLSQRRRFARRWKGVRVYGDLQKLLTTEQPDIISICTPPESHARLIQQVLEYSPKAIFCEKPVATTLIEAQKVKRALGRTKTAFSLNISRRWDRMHQKIARDIEKGRWGSVQSVDAYYTGSFLSTGTHLVDGLRMLVGEIGWVQAVPPFSRSAGGGIQAALGFEKGGAAFLHHLDRSHYLIYELDIYLSKGRVRLNDSGFESSCWGVGPCSQFSDFCALTPMKSPYGAGYQGVLKEAVNDLVSAASGGCLPLGTLEDGMRALEIQEALLKSSKEGGTRIWRRRG